jgi:putative ABC transport system substrate-binding protein
MRRREFVTLLSGATVWSLTARAQDLAMPVVGFIGSDTQGGWASRMRGFYEGLSQTGYVEGRNVAIEYRWADGQEDRLPGFAADLIRRQVRAIVVPGTAGTLATKAATTTIPIVFLVGGDPVRLGLVASLNRPGGNLTGMFNLNLNLAPTRLQMLHELVPSAALIGLLVDPINPTAEGIVRNVQAAASRLGLQVHILYASSEREFDSVFATLAQVRAGALMIGTEGFLFRQYEHLAALTVHHGVPTMFQFREYVAAGGLMTYGANTTSSFRQLGVYTGRILKGEKPADVPVEQPSKLELVINLKTAKMLGLTVPPTMLARADEVIE